MRWSCRQAWVRRLWRWVIQTTRPVRVLFEGSQCDTQGDTRLPAAGRNDQTDLPARPPAQGLQAPLTGDVLVGPVGLARTPGRRKWGPGGLVRRDPPVKGESPNGRYHHGRRQLRCLGNFCDRPYPASRLAGGGLHLREERLKALVLARAPQALRGHSGNCVLNTGDARLGQ